MHDERECRACGDTFTASALAAAPVAPRGNPSDPRGAPATEWYCRAACCLLYEASWMSIAATLGSGAEVREDVMPEVVRACAPWRSGPFPAVAAYHAALLALL